MRLTALPAFADNYIWALVADDGQAVVVDPGDAGPVLAAATQQGWTPTAILLTHHHNDHIGGVAALQARYPGLAVYAPDDPRIPMATHRVAEGECIQAAGQRFHVVSVPGHTRFHIAFHTAEHLFSGDALFSLGCGRMFEGTPSQLLASLHKLASLPPHLLLCCGHEYTVSNAVFARHVDPTNAALLQRHEEALAMRRDDRPTLPVSLASELHCNPFLRTGTPSIQQAVSAHLGRPVTDEVDVVAGLRGWKDGFGT
ncbi:MULTISPECIES: hydroxyacylglutathione hydrolase [unclassified Stenotrophomonas]|jgi:hydroxyacylglutathione hydrolase|uniref:hydroxyacylglutathione hydrolase n=1 Tax=Stenotrophomonas TaxID=40323 RepID=UPI000D4CF7D3|nr:MULTISPECIES: hydroxyacylglutathione hydrolase [unclassified Stenotrophomonas]PTT62288.1 hydroxyacylglutathione hydrolase [Stenotrophomonas sp. HMWF003]QHB70353.1 hydroxyacylglutathione hydrolase [Stenotrophomonas sp. 364]